jgi:hypothetical protein
MIMFRKTLGLLILCGVAVGNESATGDNTVAFEDSFERSELGDRWLVITPSFSIKDGRLVGQEEPNRNHVAVCRVPLTFRNGVFEFSFRLTDGKNINIVINDKNYKQAHAGHICRVAISSSLVRISDDREGAFRKDLYKAFLASGRTIDRRVQLKDREKMIPHSLKAERWHKARILLKDDQIAVTINEKSVGSFRSPGIAHPTKTDFGFAVLGNTIEFDDIRVSNIDAK